MPAIIPFIPLIVGAGATALGWGAVGVFAATIIAGIAVGDYQKRRAVRKQRDAFNAGLKDRLISWPLISDGARSRVYGRVRNVDGSIFVASHGVHDEFLTVFVALAGHEIDGIEKVFLNDVCVDVDPSSPDFSGSSPQLNGTGYVQVAPYNRVDNSSTSETFSINGGAGSVVLTQTPVVGSVSILVSVGLGDHQENTEVTSFTVSGNTVTVSGALFANGEPITGFGRVTYNFTESTSYVRIRKYLGALGQNVSDDLAALVPTLVIPGQHRFDNIAGLLVTMEFSPDPFPGGPPQISSVFRGAKCTDPRTGAFAWTENSSVIGFDWARYPYGGGLLSSVFDGDGTVDELDLASFQDAANACDVDTAFTTTFLGGIGDSSIVTITNASPAVVTWNAHGRVAGSRVRLFTTGALPTGLVTGFNYYVIAAGLTADAFRVSATLGGTAINTSSAGSGAHTARGVTVTSAPRYTCGIVAKTDSNAGDVFEEIVASMAGQYGWSGGKLRVRAGAWRAPVATITEDWVSDKEAIAIQPAPGLADTFNILRPSISDAARDYAFAPVPQVRSEPYITADGQELSSEITLSAVTQAFRAQDICEVLLLEGRQAMTVTLPCNMRAFALDLFDVIEVTLPHYGWTAKDFEIRGWRFSALGGVILLLREVAAASYDVATLFTIDDLSDNTELPKPWVVNPVEGFAVTSTAALSPDSQIVTRTLATWLPHSQAAVLQNGRIEIQWLDLIGQPQTVQWINANGDIATWEDDDGSGVEWVSGGGMVPVLMTWANTLGAMTWTNDVETTLEWYQEIGAPVIPLGDWRAKFEPGGGTSTEVAALSPGHIYLFRARAINSIGVRSAWNTQVSIRIADAPLVQTSGIALNAATEVFITTDASDSWTTAFTGIQIRQLAPTTYTNASDESVDIEFNLTSSRRITTPASASNLDIVALLVVTITPPGGGFVDHVGPGAPTVNYVEDMGPSAVTVFSESAAWKITLPAGYVADAYSEIRVVQGAYSGVTVDTSNLHLRMTIVKR